MGGDTRSNTPFVPLIIILDNSLKLILYNRIYISLHISITLKNPHK